MRVLTPESLIAEMKGTQRLFLENSQRTLWSCACSTSVAQSREPNPPKKKKKEREKWRTFGNCAPVMFNTCRATPSQQAYAMLQPEWKRSVENFLNTPRHQPECSCRVPKPLSFFSSLHQTKRPPFCRTKNTKNLLQVLFLDSQLVDQF